MPGTLGIKLNAVGHNRRTALNEMVSYLGHGGPFTTTGIEDSQLATINVDGLQDPAQGDLIRREIPILDEVFG